MNYCRATGVTNSRAIVIIPQVDAFERFLANDVRARFVRRAVPLHVPSHGRLTPLRPVRRRRQRQIPSLQTYVVQASCGHNYSVVSN